MEVFKHIKLLIILFLIFFSHNIFAVTNSEALASCNAYLLANPVSNPNFTQTCQFRGTSITGTRAAYSREWFWSGTAPSYGPSWFIDSCDPGQTADSNGFCQAPVIVQDCPADQFKNSSGICEPITTDCNQNGATSGNYFNVATGQCQSGGPMVICITKDANGVGGGNSYCPPVQDCIPNGQICSNNQITVDTALQARNAKVAAATAKADAAASEAAQAKADAAAAKSAKDAANNASSQQASAAQAAAQAASSASGPASTSAIQAAQAAAQAAQRQAADAIAAANSASQQLIADYQEAIARSARDFLNGQLGTIGGNSAGDLGEQSSEASRRAKQASIGAIGGYPPDGQASAGDTGIPENFDCPDCAKESTLQSMMNGTGNIIQSGTLKGFDHNAVDSDIATAKTAYTDKVTQIKTQFSQVFNVELTGSGDLPIIDFGTIKGAHVVFDMSRYTGLSLIGNIILFMAGFIALRTILDF